MKNKFLRSTWLLLLLAAACACSSPGQDFCPTVKQCVTKADFQALDSAFVPLSAEETAEAWGRELMIGMAFARDFDLYRAITSFKRAQLLVPTERMDRRLQVDYHVIQAYYLGDKLDSAISAFENSELTRVSPKFPAYEDLLTMLHHAYRRLCRDQSAEDVLKLMQAHNAEQAVDLELSWALQQGQVEEVRRLARGHRSESAINNTLDAFCCQQKSVQRAKVLQAILPGAGYLYVGQGGAAVTSFALNALFIAAAYYFFDDGNWAAGAITLSLEGGWYFGGINGAGIAANEYNEWAYESLTGNMMNREQLFPILQFSFSF